MEKLEQSSGRKWRKFIVGLGNRGIPLKDTRSSMVCGPEMLKFILLTLSKEIFVPKLLSVVKKSRRIATKTLTETQEKYLRFFSEIPSKFKEIKPEATERRATADSCLQIPTGFNSIHFEWLFR